MSRFTYINQEKIAQIFRRAESTIIYLAPGITSIIADEIIAANRRNVNITVVLDVSSDVQRMGLGEVSAVEKIDKAGINIRKTDRLRIGFVKCDFDSILFTPVAQIYEKEPENEAFPNAIEISSSEAVDIVKLINPTDDRPAAIGVKTLLKNDVVQVEKELRVRPAIRPDLARRIYVLSSLFQIVELEFKFSKPQSHTIRISASMFGISNDEMKKKFDIKYKLFEDLVLLELNDINIELDRIKGEYLIRIPNEKPIIDMAKRNEFDKDIEKLKAKIEVAKNDISTNLSKYVESEEQKLIDLLAENLKKSLSKDKLAKFVLPYEYNIENLKRMVYAKIAKLIPKPDNFVDKMELKLKIYNVSDQLIDDDNFKKSIEKAYGKPFDEVIKVKSTVEVEPLNSQN